MTKNVTPTPKNGFFEVFEVLQCYSNVTPRCNTRNPLLDYVILWLFTVLHYIWYKLLEKGFSIHTLTYTYANS